VGTEEDGGVTLELVGPDELPICGIGCVTNPRHPGFEPKGEWLRRRFDDGLRYLLFRDRQARPLGFLEFVPGEHAWRPVDAAGWLFVHCLWVYPRGKKIGGLGMRLVEACLAQGRSMRAIGVATLASAGPWMAGPEIFERLGFERLAEADRFALLGYRLRPGPAPTIHSVEANRAQYAGLHIVYSPQCPYLPKSVADLRGVAAELGLNLRVTVLETPREAQRAPSYYGVFALLWNGQLLSDHYVSATRFRSLVRQHRIATPDGPRRMV
jgi:hypothetical protein